MYATRISMTIGLLSVALSLVLGLLLGGVSGFHGGWIDTLIQRVIEILRSIPTIPLWMGLAAAVPKDWSVTKMYFAITIILSAIGLPVEAIGLILVTDRVLDMVRTSINVFSDSCGAVIIARSEGEDGLLGESSS